MSSQIASSPHLAYFLIYTAKPPWLSLGCATVSAQWGNVNRDIRDQPCVAQSQTKVKVALPFRYETAMRVATKLSVLIYPLGNTSITSPKLWARKEGSRELQSRSKNLFPVLEVCSCSKIKHRRKAVMKWTHTGKLGMVSILGWMSITCWCYKWSGGTFMNGYLDVETQNSRMVLVRRDL